MQVEDGDDAVRGGSSGEMIKDRDRKRGVIPAARQKRSVLEHPLCMRLRVTHGLNNV